MRISENGMERNGGVMPKAMGAAILLIACAALLPSCSITYDQGAMEQRKVHSAPSTGGSRWPFGIRYDPEPAERRCAEYTCQAQNPCTVPSYSEMRKAKANAQALAEVQNAGGPVQIQPDGSASDPSAVKFVAAANALTIDVAASPQLNSIDGVPHAVVFCIYQVSDASAFRQLAGSAEGLRKLLEGESFGDSVKSVRRVFIQPGSRETLRLDRAEDARCVGLVVGYNNLNPEACASVAAFGVRSYKKSNGAMILKRSVEMYSPMPLTLTVQLNPENMGVFLNDPGLNANPAYEPTLLPAPGVAVPECPPGMVPVSSVGAVAK